MIEHKEVRLVPDMSSVHVKDGCENPCEKCEEWGPKCESCDVSVPLVADRWKQKEVTYGQMVICGIPIGNPYPIAEKRF